MDLKTLQEQKMGSDLHGLTQHVAYKIGQHRGGNPSQNWDDAQRAIIKLAKECENERNCDFLDSPELYHRQLELCAPSWRTGNLGRDWELTQASFADWVFCSFLGQSSHCAYQGDYYIYPDE